MTAIKTVPLEPGYTPRRSPTPRYCLDCGTKVNQYKNPRAMKTRCYCCEDKLPWTYALIVGGGVHGEDPQPRVPKHPKKATTKIVGHTDSES